LSSKQQAQAYNSESDDDSSDDDSTMVQTNANVPMDDGIIDALTPPRGQCEERLWISEDEM